MKCYSIWLTTMASIRMSYQKAAIIFFIFVLLGNISTSRGQNILSENTASETIQQIIEELGDSDFLTNYYAGRKIIKIGKEATPYLIKALDHDKGKVRLAAIVLLEQMKETRAIPEFIRIFKDGQRKERERAAVCLALGRLGAKESADVLIKGLSESSSTIKMACATSLGMLKEEKAVPYLVKYAQDKESEIGRACLRALQSIGDKAVPELEKLLKEGVFEEKLLALEMLGNLKNENSIEVLKKVLQSDNRYLAISSAYILSTMEYADGREVALKLLNDTDPKIKTLAAKTLENIEKIRGKR